jgi:molybdenum cofactor cytidylyltransferase
VRQPSRIVALILAAGRSSRFGAFKPLAPLGSSTLIGESVARFHMAGVLDVRVVVGHRFLELIPVVERLGARWVVNPDPDRGMFSSVLAGVESFEPEVRAFFLLPVDIPLVKPRTIRTLLDAYCDENPRVIYPRFNGERGHPPLIPASCLRGELPPDFPGGLRAFLSRHDEAAEDVDVVDESILLDCDTVSDYRMIVRRSSEASIPTEAECEAICSCLQVPERVVAHCRRVAEVARVLAVHLNQAGHSLNLPLVLAAGRLHDLARDQPDHGRAGAAILSEMGYPRVAAVVATHMDIRVGGSGVTEAELLYLADKCVEEHRLVTLEERFERSLNRLADRPGARQKVMKRQADALIIGKRVEGAIGSPLSGVLHRHARSIHAASTDTRREIRLVRHGAIQSPGEPRRFIGHLDLPLTGEGIVQAERLGQSLGDVPLSAVFCSDLKRSKQTAEIIARAHGLACVQRSALREISLGQWEGLSFDAVRRSHPEAFMARGTDILHYRPPGGESFFDCTLRVVPAFYTILAETRGNILIVGHAGVNRILLSQVLGRSLEDLLEIEQDCGCLNVVVARYGHFEVKLLNNSPYKPEERVSDS